MGKFNEIQEESTQSWGGNSFTTKVTDTTVEFDSAKDSFTFNDPVEVPSINIGGTQSVPFSAEDKTKLDNLQTPMQIKGRVDSVGDLPTEDVTVGDVYLVGASGSANFEEYICTELSGSPEAPVWENLGHVKVQADWNQSDSNADDYIKNRICYDTTVVYADVENPNAEEHEPTSSIYFEAPIPTVGDTVNVQYKYWTGGMNPHWEEVNQNVTVGPYMNPGEAVVQTSGVGAITIFYKESWADKSHPEATGLVSTVTIFDEIVVVNADAELKTIDDKFIPDTVARVADLTQADWNQTTATSVDYIKNKPAIVRGDDDTGAGTCVIIDGNTASDGSANTLVAGSGNAAQYGASNNLISGSSNNTNSGTTGTIVTGNNNYANATSNSIVYGQNNSTIWGCLACTVAGMHNVGSGQSNFVNGKGNQTFSSALSSIVNGMGESVTLTRTAANTYTASGNYTKYIGARIYFGVLNGNVAWTVITNATYASSTTTFTTDADYAPESGSTFNVYFGNQVYGSNSIVSGEKNVAISCGKNNLVSGQNNSLLDYTSGNDTTLVLNSAVVAASNAILQGSQNSAIIASDGVTIQTATNTAVIGCTNITATESNTVYMTNANASGIFTLGTLQLKDDNGLLGISSDGGTTFKPVSRAYNTYKDSSDIATNKVVDFKSHKYFVSDEVGSSARIRVVASDCNDDVLYEDSFNIFVSSSRSVFTDLIDLVDTGRTGGLNKFTNVSSGNLSAGTYHVTIKYERISGTYKLGRLYVLFEQVYSL